MKKDIGARNRELSLVKKYAWVVTILVALGGQWVPELGLLVPLIMLTLSLMSLFRGRYWCGNFCPHGSFFDTFVFPVSRNLGVPKIFRSRVFVFFFFFFFLLQLGRRFFLTFGDLHHFSRQVGFIFSSTYLMVLILGGLAGFFFQARAWCYFCPMGTLQLFFYRLGQALGLTRGEKKITITKKEECRLCGKCARACPLHLTPYQNVNKEGEFDDENCIRCQFCVQNCLLGILELSSVSERKRRESSG